MIGFIIKNKLGSYLTKYLYWYKHDAPEDAYVFENINSIISMSQKDNWEFRPHSYLIATYELGKVIVKSNEIEV